MIASAVVIPIVVASAPLVGVLLLLVVLIVATWRTTTWVVVVALLGKVRRRPWSSAVHWRLPLVVWIRDVDTVVDLCCWILFTSMWA